jgi:hypothetical protein
MAQIIKCPHCGNDIELEITVKGKQEQVAPGIQQQPSQGKGKLRYIFGVLNDDHFDVDDPNKSEYKGDLMNALVYMRSVGAGFIGSCGDLCQYNDKDYEEFKDYYNAYAWAPTGGKLRLLTSMGNHDYLRIYHKRSSVPAGYDSVEMLWQNNISVFHEPESDIHFFEYGAKWNDPKKSGKRTIKSKLNYWLEYNGDILVFMSVDYGESTGSPWDDVARGFNLLDYNDQYVKQMTAYVIGTDYDRNREKNFDYQFYNAEVLCWLKDILEANKNRRIFVFNHHFLPNKAGDTFGEYSRLRIWPYPTSEVIRNKYYSGSNTVCGLTFHFLNKLMRENLHTIFFNGHSHYEWKAQEDCITREYKVKLPTGNEVTPLVDDLNTLRGTEYDYQLYTPIGHSVCDCAPTVHVPSLSKPVSREGKTLYGASQGAVVEVYEGGVTVKCIQFKADGSSQYTNKVIKTIDL